MKEQKIDRRIFIRNTAVTAAAVTLVGESRTWKHSSCPGQEPVAPVEGI